VLLDPRANEVAQLRARVFRFILKAIGHAGDAEDLTQRVILVALENLQSFRQDAALSTWVIGIAFNMVRSHRRMAAGNRRFVGEEALEAVPSNDPPLAAHYVVRDELQRLHRAIATLPDEFREAILLVSLEELTYEQAAEILGVPIGRIRSRVFRARQLLRSALA